MKTKLISILILMSSLWCGAMDRWEALSMTESGDCDTCVGPSGEVSRWQIMPKVWKETTSLPLSSATNRDTAYFVTICVIVNRQWEFCRGRNITDKEFALLWRCPGRINHPTKSDMDYAQRFYNLVHKDEIEKRKGAL